MNAKAQREENKKIIELMGEILVQLKSLNYYTSPETGAKASKDDYRAASFMGESKNRQTILKIHKLTGKMDELGLTREVTAIRSAIDEALNPKSDSKQIINEEIYDLEKKIRVL